MLGRWIERRHTVDISSNGYKVILTFSSSNSAIADDIRIVPAFSICCLSAVDDQVEIRKSIRIECNFQFSKCSLTSGYLFFFQFGNNSECLLIVILGLRVIC